MIVMRTRDDWSTVSIDITDGATPSTWSCSSSVQDARAALLDLAAHMLSTYADGGTVTWSSSTSGVAAAEMETINAYDYTPNAAATALLGASAQTGATSMEAVAPSGVVAPHTVSASDPSVAVTSPAADLRPDQRPTASDGAVAMASPGSTATAYRCAAYLHDLALPAMRAALAVARNPRTAQVYTGSAWITMAIGPVSIRSLPSQAHVAEWEGLA